MMYKLIMALIAGLLFITGCSTTKWIPPWIVAEDGTTLCPKCKVDMKYLPIYYGYPSEEMMEICQRGEGILGGCVIEGKMPLKGYMCTNCGAVYPDKSNLGYPWQSLIPSKLQREKNPHWRDYYYDDPFKGGYDKLDFPPGYYDKNDIFERMPEIDRILDDKGYNLKKETIPKNVDD